MSAASAKLGTWQSLRTVAASWRLGSVALLSFSSGLPLGLVWLAVPAWMTQVGVDIKVVGLFTLAQAPWTFKVLWAPLMDRYPLPFLGRKRGWVFLSQVALLGLGVWLGVAADPPVPIGLVALLCLATAFASATQDIAYDGYTVEVLRREEQGVAVGARVALYRAAMWVAGRLAITVAGWTSWAVVHLGLALLYLPTLVVARFAPEPEAPAQAPRTLREAVWEPFVGLLAQHRALEILSFVVLYKLSDNLTQALTGPFLLKTGFSTVDVGVASGTISLVAIVAGTFLGGILTQSRGLGPGLWISGLLQVFSNLGYAAVAEVGVNRPLMYAAQGFEYATTGMGNGAFGVLLLRLTEKRFSSTQYALLSTLFSVPRVLAGPAAGVLADAIGWRDFFVSTLIFGVPGLVMLQRFVPWGVRDVEFHLPEPRAGRPLRRRGLLLRSLAVGVASWAVLVLAAAAVAAAKAFRQGRGFDLWSHVAALLAPGTLEAWVTVAGVVSLGFMMTLGAAAALAARRGLAPRE
ncbi:MAG: MFS transporter [Acidobacteria bacterium]|nr:MFS transporter [Acidobacteriota bacterium]